MVNKLCSFSFFIFLGFLFSCQQGQKTKIGFLLPNVISDRYEREKAYFSESIAKLGGEAIVVSGENNDKLQIQQAKDLMGQGIKVLVINAINRFTAAEIVRIAHEGGVPVIAYDRLICNSDLDFYLSYDNEKVGELMAEYAIRKKPSGKYVIFSGDKTDLNATYVKNGQLKVLEPYVNSGKIKIVYNVYIEDWAAVNAQHELKTYLDLSAEQPDVILSSYDGMSTGIIKTLTDYGLEGKVLVTGQDAEIAACQNIVKGYQDMTVFKSLKKLAGKAAELSMKLAGSSNISNGTTKIFNGKKDVPSVLLEPVVVDKENMRPTVIAEGHLSESEVYKK